MIVYKSTSCWKQYIIMLDLCTHVQNNDFLSGLNIGGKMLF